MDLWTLIAFQALLLGSGLGIVALRCPAGRERMDGYLVVSLGWLFLQVLGWGLELFPGGLA